MTIDNDEIGRGLRAVASSRARADHLLAIAVELSVRLMESSVQSRLHLAHFLAQAAHECGGFSRFVENLNYSAPALLKTWPRHFPTREIARRYERKPEAIANRAYADRMGNGPEGSGDGWRFRGRGIFQLTGRDNYTAGGEALGLDLVANPELAAVPSNAVRLALWFWDSRKLSRLADRDDVRAVTKGINGGLIGLDDRKARLLSARRALGV